MIRGKKVGFENDGRVAASWLARKPVTMTRSTASSSNARSIAALIDSLVQSPENRLIWTSNSPAVRTSSSSTYCCCCSAKRSEGPSRTTPTTKRC